MSDIKISALPVASTLDGTEVFPLVQSGVTKKGGIGTTLKDYLSGSYIPLSGTVSPITGNIQLDWDSEVSFYNESIIDNVKNKILFGQGAISIDNSSYDNTYRSFISFGFQEFGIGSNVASFSGLKYIDDFSANFTDNSLPNRLYNDGRYIKLTTKGDLATFSTEYTRLAVGSDGQVLIADSSTATGLRWGSISSGVSSVFGRTGAVTAQVGDYSSFYQALNTNLTSLSGLTYASTSFVKMTASGTFALDTNTYLTGNQTITLSGDVTGSGTTAITTSISNTVVTGKLLTGYVSGAGTVSATDSILQAIQKLNGNISALTTGVSSVSGTTNRITASPTSGAVVVDISASYVGQSSITTLGTVTSGGLGTGATLGGVTMSLGSDALGDLHYSGASNVLTRIPIGTRGNILQVGASSVPQWNSNILDSNGNTVLGFNPTLGAGNFWTVINNSGTNAPILSTPDSGAGTDQVGIGGQINLGLGTSAGLSGRLNITTGTIATTGSVQQTRFSLLQLGALTTTTAGMLLNTNGGVLSLSNTVYNFNQGNNAFFINSPIASSSLVFRINNATIGTFTANNFTLSPAAASSSGWAPVLTVTGTADTGRTAATEFFGAQFNFAQSIQWAAGTTAVQRQVVFQAPTYTGVAATATFTDAATVAITGAPTAGTNAAITRGYAFWVQAGNSRFDGNITSRGAGRTWGTEDAQTLAFQTNGTARYTLGTTGAHTFTSSALNGTTFVTFTQAVSTSGSSAGLLWTGAAHTGQTASTELTDINFNLARTVTLAAGTVATQRAFRIQAPTYAGSAATANFTTAATLAISNAPQQGTNAAITTALALWVENGNSRFSGLEVQMRHLRGVSTAPTIAAGVGAGTTPTVSLTGTDLAGIVTVTTGTTPTGSNAIVVTVTFNTAYSVAPYVVLTPANRNALALGTGTEVCVPANGQTNGVTTTTFVIESGATALAASTQYIWTYMVIQ